MPSGISMVTTLGAQSTGSRTMTETVQCKNCGYLAAIDNRDDYPTLIDVDFQTRMEGTLPTYKVEVLPGHPRTKDIPIYNRAPVCFRLVPEMMSEGKAENGVNNFLRIIESDRLKELGLWRGVSVSREAARPTHRYTHEVTEIHETAHCFYELYEAAIEDALGDTIRIIHERQMEALQRKLSSAKTPERQRRVVHGMVDILRERFMDRNVKHEIIAWIIDKSDPATRRRMFSTYDKEWDEKMSTIVENSFNFKDPALRSYAKAIALSDMHTLISLSLMTLERLEAAHIHPSALVDFAIATPFSEFAGAADVLLRKRDVST